MAGCLAVAVRQWNTQINTEYWINHVSVSEEVRHRTGICHYHWKGKISRHHNNLTERHVFHAHLCSSLAGKVSLQLHQVCFLVSHSLSGFSEWSEFVLFFCFAICFCCSVCCVTCLLQLPPCGLRGSFISRFIIVQSYLFIAPHVPKKPLKHARARPVCPVCPGPLLAALSWMAKRS